MAEGERQPERPAKRSWIFHAGLTGAGLVVLGVVVAYADPSRLALAVSGAAYVLPIVILFEGLRIVCDARTTMHLFRYAGAEVPPLAPIFRAQLAAYPYNVFVPAGRAAGEAIKAVLLAPWVGPAVATAAAIQHPALSLGGTFLASIPVATIILLVIPGSAVGYAVAVQALTAIALALFLVVAARRRGLASVVRRASERAGAVADEAQAKLLATPAVPAWPLALQVAGRGCMAVELGALAIAAGASPTFFSAVLATGVQMVGQAAGDLVPGQIGATDGAFALAADTLRMEVARAVTIPLLYRASQLFWTVAGVLVPLLWRDEAGRRGD